MLSLSPWLVMLQPAGSVFIGQATLYSGSWHRALAAGPSATVFELRFPLVILQGGTKMFCLSHFENVTLSKNNDRIERIQAVYSE